jgi:hypothetical protein
LKVKAPVQDVEKHHKSEKSEKFAAILFSALVKPLRGEQSLAAAAVEFAVAEVDGPAPYSAEPTLGWQLEDCRPPFQQKPSESCTAGCHQSTKSAAYPAQFSVAPDVEILVESSPLPAFSYLLLLSRVASYALHLRPPAIAVEALVDGP